MEWYDNYKIGVEHLDNQHKELVKTLDTLQKSLKSSNINAEIGTALKFIVNYTQHHFAEEEELMLAVNFPDYDNHKKLHQRLLKDVVNILNNLKKGKPINAYELFDFLVDWLRTHIINEDQRIAMYVKAQKEKEKVENIYNTDEVKKNISNKIKQLKNLYDKELITDSEYEEKKSFVVKDFISLQEINSKKALDEFFTIVGNFVKSGMISSTEAKDIKIMLIKKLPFEQILKEFNKTNEGLLFLDSLLNDDIISQKDYDANKALVLKEI